MQQEVKLHKAESAWKSSHKETKEVKDEEELNTEVCFNMFLRSDVMKWLWQYYTYFYGNTEVPLRVIMSFLLYVCHYCMSVAIIINV